MQSRETEKQKLADTADQPLTGGKQKLEQSGVEGADKPEPETEAGEKQGERSANNETLGIP